MLHALSYWLHDRDPLLPLAFEAPLARIKERVAARERCFEDLIAQYLITNPHRTTTIVAPDPEQAQREAGEERQRLDAARARMSRAEVQSLVEDTRTLKLITRGARHHPEPHARRSAPA
jgi:Zn-dependent M16 (insulinase) family peptidase